MRPMRAPLPPQGARRRRRHDPAPSRLRYRLTRLWRRKTPRAVLRLLLPPLIVAGVGWKLAGEEELWRALDAKVAAAHAALAARPEFAVTRMEISGATPRLEARLRAELGFVAPQSSLNLDLKALRAAAAAVPRVREAEVRITPEGVLAVRVTERAPAALWRIGGDLRVVDIEGVTLSRVTRRSDWPTLPLIIGKGAADAVPEALALQSRVAPLSARLRGFVRVGERRWNVALDRDQAILLPEQGAETALRDALDMHFSDDLFDRDIAHLDMRLEARPTIRLNDGAVRELIRLRTIDESEGA